MPARKYSLPHALRPFSLVVALVTCGLGVALAYRTGDGNPLRAALVLTGGLLLQMAVNLINDHADLTRLRQLATELGDGRSPQHLARQIQRNFRIGLVCLSLAAVPGVWLSLAVGWPFLLLCLAGLTGLVAYTFEPVNYKRRGLGVVLVFFLMGVLMVSGAHTAVSGRFDPAVLWLSLPVSFLTALLLLSNELRDQEQDQAAAIATLTVRLGHQRARRLYAVLALAPFAAGALLQWSGLAPWFWLTLASIPALAPALERLDAPAGAREALPPLTGRFYLSFGLLYLVGFGLGYPPGEMPT